MAPPAFADIGKEARDVLSKNYCLGIVKLDLKTKTPLGVEFNVNGVSNNDTGKVTAFLESKHTCKEYGLTVKERWNADNTLSTEVTLDDPCVKGAKVGLNGFFAPQSGRKNGSFKMAFKNDLVHLKHDFNYDHAGTSIVSSAVVGTQGYLAGVQLGYDHTNSKVTNTNIAAGYQTTGFALTANVVNANEINGSIFQKVNSNLETGVTLGWATGASNTKFGLGAVYKLDCCTSVRAKVNNSSQIGLGFTHKLRPGVNMTLSALIEGKNLNQGGHKLGVGIEFEA